MSGGYFNEWFRQAVNRLPEARSSRRHQVYNVVAPWGLLEINHLEFTLKIERLSSGTEAGVWRFNDLIVRIDPL